MRVLIVEDDPNLAGLLRDGLRAQRIDPTLAATFAEGRDRAQGGSFDVIILDVRLPGGTGLELCGEQARGELDTGPDADGTRCPRRPGAGARGRGGRLSHEAVCVPGARGAPQGARASPARPVAGP